MLSPWSISYKVSKWYSFPLWPIVFLCGIMMISGGSFGSASSAMPMVDENTDLAYFCRSPNTPVGNACIARVCLFGGICGTYWDGQRAYCDCQ